MPASKRASYAIHALDRHQGREFLATAAALPAHGAGSLGCGSRWMTCLAWSRSARRPRREAWPLRDVCFSTFPDPRERHPCQESSRSREVASSPAVSCADLAREGATRGASPSILRKCGGQGASPRPAASSLAASSSSFSMRTWLGVHPGVRIAELGEALRNREDSEVGWVAVGDLMPVERRGHAGVGKRAHGIRRARRPILRVLVVVEENAVTLLLPPLRTSQGR